MANLDGRAAPLFEGVRLVFPGPAMSWRRVSSLHCGRRPNPVGKRALKQDTTGSDSAG